MKHQLATRLLAACSLLAILTACDPASETDTTALETEARDLTGQFTGTLLPTLQSALTEGGPVQAIEFCSERAPAIAAELSAVSGWSVHRVSLKPRNVEMAIADSWERHMLEEFDRRQQVGEAGATINTAAVVGDEFRYMQAQPATPLCLTKHNAGECSLAGNMFSKQG